MRGNICFYSIHKTVIKKIYRQISCWSCKSEYQKLHQDLFCPNCKSLQQPNKEANFFAILGVNETYDVNVNKLANKYKNLQKYLHPDKFANKNKDEQVISETYSSLVNSAYNTLLDPLSRGIYMLKLKGLEIPEKTELENSFLMDIMEFNEQVEEAETKEEILKLEKENNKCIDELQKQVSKAFFDGDLETVTKLLGKLRYFSSIDDQIQVSIRNMGIIR